MTDENYTGQGIWCVAELRHGSLVPTIFELLTAGRKLAEASKQPLCAVVLGGPGASQAAQAVASRGAERVYLLEHPALEQFVDEAHSQALASLVQREKPAKVLFPASAIGRSLASRTAVLCRAGLASDVTEVGLDSEGRLTVTRPCYGGNLLVSVTVRRGPAMASLRPMAYPRLEAAGKPGEVVPVPVDPGAWKLRTKFTGFAPEKSKEIDLSGAEKIVSGGRGLGNAKGFDLVRELADMLGAAVGASRSAVDAGWITYRHQVGLTGRTVRPKLYMAFGISGQIQHLAGMSSSDVIVAVNTDKDCPMMQLASIAVQGEYAEILPLITNEIKSRKGQAVAA